MALHTLLLVRSSNAAWESFRGSLAVIAGLRVIGDVAVAAAALDLVTHSSPDLIVAGATVADSSALPLLCALRDRSPASRFVIIVDHPDEIVPADLLARHGLIVEGQLLWSESTPGKFHRCAGVILDDDCVMASRAVAEAFMEALRRPEGPTVVLSSRQHAVLTGLANDLTREQIAEMAELNIRTVKRTIAELETKLDASSPFTLGMKASKLGLVP